MPYPSWILDCKVHSLVGTDLSDVLDRGPEAAPGPEPIPIDVDRLRAALEDRRVMWEAAHPRWGLRDYALLGGLVAMLVGALGLWVGCHGL
jgi:hypothetical protein